MNDQEKIRLCAEASHEMNRIYCRSLGDHSQCAWRDAAEWQRASAVNGVRGVLAGNGPRASHALWLDEKLRTGWTHGPVKDPVAKTHPCILAFDELPRAQQLKNELFVASVRSMANALGLMCDAPVHG